MSKTTEATIPPCLGDYGSPGKDTAECDKTCKFVKKCIEVRQAIRELMIRKLDSGFRQYIIGHLWSKGDALASGPLNDHQRIVMILEAYMDIFGMTDMGKTALADESLYKQVVEYHDDLIALLNALYEDLPKCKTPEQFEVRVEPILVELEDKYSKKGVKIYANPSKLLRVIKSSIYKEIYPKVMATITTIPSLETKGFPTMYNPNAVPRFRRADLDGQGRQSRT